MQIMVLMSKVAQFKIQQMAFMLIAVFIFFTLVGLFFLQISLGDLRYSAEQLEKKQVLSALLSWSELPELSCSDRSSSCIDEDKLYVLSSQDYNRLYSSFWPVASIRVYKVNSNFSLGELECPQPNCNYYNIYKSDQISSQPYYAAYVSLCKKNRLEGQVFESCELATLSLQLKSIPS
jgi:hypothetical protein